MSQGWSQRIVCALLVVGLACGGMAGAKGSKKAAKPSAPVVAVPENASVEDAINVLKQEDVINPKKDRRVDYGYSAAEEKVAEQSAELLKHFEAFQQGQEALKDYPYIETLIHLYKFRHDMQKRFPAGALEPFYAVGGCRPKEMPLLVQAPYRPMPEHEIKTLLTAGENPNAKDADGDTPLHEAVRCRLSVKAVKALLKAGAKVNEPNKEGHTPLHLAVQAGADAKVLRALLEAGADPQAAPSDKTWMIPMRMAKDTCTPESLREMVKAGMNVAIKDKNGFNMLYYLSWNGKLTPEMLEILLKAGSTVNDRYAMLRITPVMMALPWMDERLFQAFVAAKADFSVVDANGQNCLHRLMLNNKATPAMLKVVLKSQEDVNKVCEPTKSTPLHFAAYYGCPKETVERLLKAGAKKDMKDWKGKTPLDLAREKKRGDLVELLDKS